MKKKYNRKVKRNKKPAIVKRKQHGRFSEAEAEVLTEAISKAIDFAFEKRNELLKSIRPPRPKRIEEYTDEELNHAIQSAKDTIPGFWTIMRGVDAYLERRKRKQGGEA